MSARILYPTQEDFDFVGSEKYRQIRTSGTGTVENRWLRSDGRVIDVLLSSSPIDLNDLERGVTFSALDITERKLMEERLRHSEKMEAIGQLAGGVAHDFNNQLTGILGYAELLLEKARHDAAMARYLGSILVCGRRAADLTDKLLAFARRGKYLSVPVDIHRTVAEAVSLLERSINKNILIRQNLKAPNPVTVGDPPQLLNSILNLALNARDAMPDGGVLTLATDVVRIDASEARQLLFEIAPGLYVKVSVTDTGRGIDPAVVGRIFEPFFTTKEEGMGTGMGLSAVYGTVKIHKGGISVRTRAGAGSEFTLFLPAHGGIPGSGSREPPAGESAIFAGKHVLIIDDEEAIRDFARIVLEAVGCRVTSCCDGKEAVDVYRRLGTEIDAVVLDLIMPLMDGLTVFRALKEINPAVRVLLSSGYTADGDARNLIAEGAAGFLPKPFGLNVLTSKLSALLGKAD
jgi:signal transduction histidine kinase